jgi:hypothetical protein
MGPAPTGSVPAAVPDNTPAVEEWFPPPDSNEPIWNEAARAFVARQSVNTPTPKAQATFKPGDTCEDLIGKKPGAPDGAPGIS